MSHGCSLPPGSSQWGSAQRGDKSGYGCAPCRWEEQRDLVGTAAAEPRDLQKDRPQSAAVVVRWLAFLTKKQRHGAMPPHSLPELASLQPCCQVTENIIWEPEMWYNGITFLPWAKGVLCDQSQCWGTGGMLQRSKVTITRRAKQQRSWPSSSAH